MSSIERVENKSSSQHVVHRRIGLDNSVFDYNNEDLDRIDVISNGSISSTSSASNNGLHAFNGSQYLLANIKDSDLPYKRNNPLKHYHSLQASDVLELTGISSYLLHQRQRRSITSPTAATTCGVDESTVTPTPTNRLRRWSQNISRFSKNKRSFSERTIYRLPSRKAYEVDGKLLSATNDDPAAEMEQLVREMEQYKYLMEDTLRGQHNRLETLRALPQPLSIKRQLKSKLSFTIERCICNPNRDLKIRLFNSCIYAIMKIYTTFGVILNSIEIWYDALKSIEGQFGSNVGSYFKFLRWLLFLNLFLFIFTFGFISIPQMIYFFMSENTNAASNSGIMLSYDGLSLRENEIIGDCETLSFLDILTGEGLLQSSFMFYGSYTNDTIIYDHSHHKYSLPHAYYMTMLILYLSTFVVISTSMARSYRKSFIEASGGMRNMYGQKIFCAWDCGISATKAAELKHFTIFSELREMLSELGDNKVNLPFFMRIWFYSSHIVAQLLVCALIGALGIAIWILLKEFGEDDETPSWEKLYVAAAINLSMLLLQSIFSWIARLEDYKSPRRTLHVMLVRNFLLEAVLIGVLVYFWLTSKHGNCWETSFGQEIYRLIVSDFIISLLMIPTMTIIRVWIINYYWPKCGRPYFDISQNSLGLVFNQTLLWIGLLFAPLLAALMVVKMILLFYVKKTMLIYFCQSPRHVWRSAQTQTLYLVFTFLSLLSVIITIGYIMTQVPVSSDCGPFRDYSYMFQIFIDGVLKLRENHRIWSILMTLIRPAAVGCMLVIMAIIVYYLRAKSQACCMMVKLLKEMIYLEAKDKEFLLSNITSITKEREWLFQDHDDAKSAAADRFATASATWRYGKKRTISEDYDTNTGDEIKTNNAGNLHSRNV